MNNNDELFEDEEEILPPNPDDVKEEPKKVEELKKEIEKDEKKTQSIVINLENIQEVLLAFQFATSKLEEASKKIKEEPKQENLNFKELFENQKKEIEIAISKIEIPKYKEPEKIDIESLNNLSYELSNFQENLKENEKSKKTMIVASILMSSIVTGVLSFGLGYMWQKNSFLKDYIVFEKNSNQFSKLTDGRIIVVPSQR
jgi:hypothetical protein